MDLNRGIATFGICLITLSLPFSFSLSQLFLFRLFRPYYLSTWQVMFICFVRGGNLDPENSNMDSIAEAFKEPTLHGSSGFSISLLGKQALEEEAICNYIVYTVIYKSRNEDEPPQWSHQGRHRTGGLVSSKRSALALPNSALAPCHLLRKDTIIREVHPRDQLWLLVKCMGQCLD